MAHKTSKFEELVLKLIDEWHVPGLSIAVVQGDEIDAKSYGVSKVSGEKCTEDTIFDMASTSKTVTAAAVACLVADEKFPEVQWTTPVAQLLPDDFVLQDPETTKNVTVEDILSHRTGLPRHDSSYLGVRAEHADDAKSLTRNLRNLPFNKPLRTTYQYNNIMYTVATHLVETVSGEPYEDFVQKRLWDPLEMKTTYHDLPAHPTSPGKKHLAQGYHWDKKTSSNVEIPSYASPEGRGAGCVFSTAADYAKWTRALMKRKLPFPEAINKDLTTARSIIPIDEEWVIPFYSQSLYALGVYTESYRGRAVVGHDGAVSGFKALLRYLPELDWGVVILGNADDAFAVEQILFHVLADEVIGVREEDRIDWPKFWREWEEKESKNHDEEEEKFKAPEKPEPLRVSIEVLAGKYFDAGYKGIHLEVKDGKLFADCTDRCYPWNLTLTHLSGNKFVGEVYDVWEDDTNKMQAEFRFGKDGEVEALGLELESALDGRLIWFERVR